MESEKNGGTSNHGKGEGAAVNHKERMTANDGFYRIPTAAELRQLREMGSLQAGSLLRLQAEELVNSITPPELKTSQSTLRLEEEWVPKLSKVLAAMHSEHLEQEDLLPGFDIGVNNVQEGLNFSSPSEIAIVGSHAFHCNIKPSGAPREVDIAVTMPASCIAPRDFIGYRYLVKRALYASHLAKNLLRQKDLVRNVSVTHMRHEPCKPCLLLEPILSLQMAKTKSTDDTPESDERAVNKRKSKKRKKEEGVVPPPFSTTYSVKLLVCLPDDGEGIRGGLDPKKLSPWRSNVRREERKSNENGMISSSPPRTLLYNSCVLEDVAMLREALALQEGIGKYESARGCVLLGKVWLAQRGILSTCDGLCGHTWSMIVLHLLQTKLINQSLGPMAMFQAVLRWITTFNEVYKGHGLSSTTIPTVQTGMRRLYSQEDHKHFFNSYPVVLLDEYYGLNVLWRISVEGWAEVVNEAQHSLTALQQSPSTCFNSLFLSVAGPLLRYDAFITVRQPSPKWSGRSHDLNVDKNMGRMSSTLRDQILDKGGGGEMRVLATRISTLLKTALSDRVEIIRPLVPTPTAASGGGSRWKGECKRWEVTCKPPWKGCIRSPTIMVGLRLFPDNENATRLVDRGPAATTSCENEEEGNNNSTAVGGRTITTTATAAATLVSKAAEFRAFWGEKSDLRRFKDGGIVEAVIWKDVPSHSIIENACRYIIKRHEPGLISLDRDVAYSGGKDVAKQFLATDGGSGGGGSDKNLTRNAIQICDGVIKCLKGLPNIILNIRSISPASPMLRYTSLFPPVPHPFAGSASSGKRSTTSQVDPIPIIVDFESSSQWPNDPEAMKAVQRALLVRIHDSLRGVSSAAAASSVVDGGKGSSRAAGRQHQHHLPHPISEVSPFLVLLPGESDQEDSYYALEIFAMGFVFHVSLACGDAAAAEDNAAAAVSAALRTTTKQQFKLLSHQKRRILHHTAIHTLATRFVSYAPAVVLVHRWVASRSLSNHFSKETLELLVAHAYTSGDTHYSAIPIPGSALSGLLRFLLLLSGQDWRSEPLVVDLGGSMGHEGRREAIGAFDSLVGGERKAALHIITPYDCNNTSAWTMYKPEASVLALATRAAAASAGELLRYVSSEGWTDGKWKEGMAAAFEQIFRSQPPRFDTCFTVNTNLCWDTKGGGGAFKALERRLRGCPAMRLPAHRNLTLSSGAAAGSSGGHKRLLVGFDPVKKLVIEIEKTFDWVAVIFWNDCRRNEMGIVWRPEAFEPADFKPLHCFGSEPCKTGKVKLDKQQILREIQWLAGDIFV